MRIHIRRLLPIVIASICASAWAQESKPESSPATSAAKPSASGSSASTQAPDNGVITASAVVNTNEYDPSTDSNEAVGCKKNLEKIAAAIEVYRKDNHDIPNWFSDLVPKYLADTNALICPVTTRTGLQSAFGTLDPKIRSSYLYEFSPTPIPAVVKGSWPGPPMTVRNWKQQQMKVAGSNVPGVRCLLHEPALNLSVGGQVYESPVFWELNFTNSTTKLEDFSPH